MSVVAASNPILKVNIRDVGRRVRIFTGLNLFKIQFTAGIFVGTVTNIWLCENEDFF